MSGFIAFLLLSSGLDVLHPFQITLDPGVNQAKKKNADEHQDLDQRKDARASLDPTTKYRGHWENKSNFNLEDDKYQRDDVKSDVKVHPGAAHGGFAAFVSRQFPGLRIVRPEQFTDEQIDPDKPKA